MLWELGERLKKSEVLARIATTSSFRCLLALRHKKNQRLDGCPIFGVHFTLATLFS